MPVESGIAMLSKNRIHAMCNLVDLAVAACAGFVGIAVTLSRQALIKLPHWAEAANLWQLAACSS